MASGCFGGDFSDYDGLVPAETESTPSAGHAGTGGDSTYGSFRGAFSAAKDFLYTDSSNCGF